MTGVAPEGAALVNEAGVPILPDGAPQPTVDGATANVDGGPNPPLDAGIDVRQPEAGCRLVIDDDFSGTAPNEKWELAGAAKFETGGVVLTRDGQETEEGGIWWSEPITFGTKLTALFHYQQLTSNNPGYGIGIGWVKSNPNWILGEQGPNVALCSSGLDGIAASLRLGGTTRIDAIGGISGICDTTGGLTQDFERGSGTLLLDLTPTTFEATSAAKTHRWPNAITVSKTGFVGFTASTGSVATGTGRFTITEAKVEVCF